MKNLISTFFICLYLLNFQAYATHIAGSSISYTPIGKDTFEVVLSIYRDCKGSSLSSATINVIGISCTYNYGKTLDIFSCEKVSSLCNKTCTKCDANNCNTNGYPNGANPSCNFPYGLEKLIFKDTLYFTNTKCCKFRIEFSQSSRNGNITTCCAAENHYNYAELNRCIYPQNSSPLITIDPFTIIYSGGCYSINLGAMDKVNHDSISYQLVPALSAYASACTYQGQYTYQYPLYYDGFPQTKKYNPKTCKGIILDSITGDFKFNPMQQQVAQIAIEMTEWRKDNTCKAQKIGVTRIDYQLIIANGSSNNIPELKPAAQVRGFAGEKLCYTNIQSSDSDKNDTVLLTYNNTIPNGQFSASFPSNSIKQQFDLCWQTSLADTSSIPYYFAVTAHDNFCPVEGRKTQMYSFIVSKKPEIYRQYTDLSCGKIKLEATPLNQKNCNEVYTYQWIINGIKYYGNNAISYIKNGGKIYITLAVTVNQCTAYFYDSIYIQPFLHIDIGNDTFICKGGTINLNSTVTNGSKPFKYKWLQGIANDTLSGFAFIPTNSMDIICKVSDSNGCQNFDTLHLKVIQIPNLHIADQRKCDGDTIYFDAGNNNGNTKKYSWEDTQTGNTVSTSRHYQTNSYQNLYVTLTDTSGCMANDNVNAFFNPPINSFFGPNIYQCEMDTMQLSTTGVDSAIWTKLYNNNVLYTGTKYITRFDSNTTVLIHGYKTTGGVTCKRHDTLNIYIVQKPAITIPAVYSVCNGFNTILKITGQGNYIYKWNNGDTNYYTKVSKIGIYTVTASDIYGCSSSSTTELKNFPIQQISININNDTLYANNANFVIYDWYYNTTYDTTTISPWRYITQLGDYTVVATDSNGCVDTSKALSVNILKSGIYTTPNPYGIKVYPNPSTGIYYIESPATIHDFTIYDLTGRKVYNNMNNNNTIDLSGQPEGIYLFQINKNVWMRLAKF